MIETLETLDITLKHQKPTPPKDSHDDNIMLRADGMLFRVDFGSPVNPRDVGYACICIYTPMHTYVKIDKHSV